MEPMLIRAWEPSLRVTTAGQIAAPGVELVRRRLRLAQQHRGMPQWPCAAWQNGHLGFLTPVRSGPLIPLRGFHYTWLCCHNDSAYCGLVDRLLNWDS